MKVFDLKRLRKDKNLTQVDVATLFLCNQNFISNIENGTKQIPKDKIDILTSHFGDISEYYLHDNRVSSITGNGNQVVNTLGSHRGNISNNTDSREVERLNDKIKYLEERIADKDERIADKDQRIAEKDERIADLKHTIELMAVK